MVGVPLADHALELQEVDDGEDHKAEKGTNQASGGDSTQSLSPLREVGIFLLGAHLNAGGGLISLVLLLKFCARLAVFAYVLVAGANGFRIFTFTTFGA